MKNHDPPLNNNKIERLFSHNNKNLPLDKHYNKPLDFVLHEEFDKAILALTIDPTKQQEIEIKNQKEKITELQQKNQRISRLETNQKLTEDALNTLMYIASGKEWGYSDQDIVNLWKKFIPNFNRLHQMEKEEWTKKNMIKKSRP